MQTLFGTSWWSGRSVSRLRVVRQNDLTDCGPAALATVMRWHGHPVSVAELRLASGTDGRGTTLAGLARAAGERGFVADGVRGSYGDLRGLVHPTLVHVQSGPLQHYVVVLRAGSRRVEIADPARGRRTCTVAEFTAMWSGTALLLSGAGAPRVPRDEWASFRKVFAAEEVRIGQAVFLGALYTLLSIAVAIFLQIVMDRLIPNRDARGLAIAGLIVLGLHALRCSANYLRLRFLAAATRRSGESLVTEFLTHLFRLPLPLFRSRASGELAARLKDTEVLPIVGAQVVGTAITDLVLILGAVGGLFWLAPPVAECVVLSLAIYLLVAVRMTRRVRENHFEAVGARARHDAAFYDHLAGAEDLHQLGAIGHAIAGTTDTARAALDASHTVGVTQALANTVGDFVGAVLMLLVVTVGALSVMDGSILVGALLGSYALAATLLPSVARLADVSFNLGAATVPIQRLQDLYLSEPEPRFGEQDIALEHELALVGASAAWPSGELALDRVDFQARVGEVTGICGRSGSGKSTLVAALQARTTLTAGELRLDGRPASQLHPDRLRDRIAVVREDTHVFDGSLAANVLVGRAGADPELCQLAQATGLSEFVGRFPQGWRTTVGRGGRRLSAGERQLIGLLRALYGAPRVLISDEGTNAVDAEMAVVVRSILARYATRAAVIVVSHDAQALAQCDLVYRVDRGRIVARERRVLADARVGEPYAPGWSTHAAPRALHPQPVST